MPINASQSITKPNSGRFLQPFVINNSSLAFLPVCHNCNRPITDFADANLVVRTESGFGLPDRRQRTKVDGYTLDPIDGEVVAVHKRCETDRMKPWTPLDSVIRSDQRSVRDLVLKKLGRGAKKNGSK